MFRVPLLFILLVVPTVVGLRMSERLVEHSATPALCDCTACRTNFQTELGAVKDRIQSNYQRSFFDTVAIGLEGPSKGCKLTSLMQSWLGGRNITIGVSGSSPTQGAGVFGKDRYISQFESELQSWKGFVRNDGPSEGGVGAVNFHNAAQGGMTTLWAGHLLDLAIGDADVLIWEYTLTDHYFHTTMPDGDFDNALALKFFLQKAMALPSKPAVIMVYLWDSGTWPLGRELESSHADVLKQYADKGLDISVVYAAEATRQYAEQQSQNSSSAEFRRMIWSENGDNNHPNQLVHNMLRDSLTHLFVTAGLDACSLAQTCKHDSLEPFGWDETEQAQAGDLVASFTSRRSLPFTHWNPLFGTPKIQLLHDMGRVPELEPGAIKNALRTDRKYDTPIYPCVQSKRQLLMKARRSQITTSDEPASLLIALNHVDIARAQGHMNFRINSKQYRRPILKDQCIGFVQSCILNFKLEPLDVPDDQMPEISICLEQDDARKQAKFGEGQDIRDHMLAQWVVLNL